MTWDKGAWPKYLVKGGSININPDGRVLECDLRRADGSTVSFALDKAMADQLGKLALALPTPWNGPLPSSSKGGPKA